MRIVLALGGNALLRRGEVPEAVAQRRNVEVAADLIAGIVADNETVITHGNGPQIGLLALEAEAYRSVEPYPLDVLGAESQGMIGYLLQESLSNLLPATDVSVVVTRVEVDPLDPAFSNPSKPIGPVYDKDEAEALAAQRGWDIAPDGRWWRRVVPSPVPLNILDLSEIRLLAESGFLVICAGGGGVPVVVENGRLHGVEAVIDKDLTSALLATDLAADALVILTDVPGVALGWGSETLRWLKTASPSDLRKIDFSLGSMGPKVEAACRFVESTGRRALIGALTEAPQVMAGTSGTVVEVGSELSYY